jgi:hypothetical protein
MLTVSINIEDGLVNGATGVLRHVQYTFKPNRVIKKCIELEYPLVGSQVQNSTNWLRDQTILVTNGHTLK